MRNSPLLSCRIKVERAHKHLNDLQNVVKAFSRRNPDSIITDEESEPGVKIDRFNLREPIPLELSAYIGDIAHNLVSALDSLAMALVKSAGLVPITEEVMRDTYFPINWEKGLTDPKSKRILERIGPAAAKLILEIEPYKGGKGDDLFRLWRLNVIDKHRAVIPVAADLVGVQFIVKSGSPPLSPREGARKPRFPLKNGDELTRRGFYEPEYHAHAHFAIQIAFGEGQVFEGESLIPRLKQCINLTEGTIDIFARNVLGTKW